MVPSVLDQKYVTLLLSISLIRETETACCYLNSCHEFNLRSGHLHSNGINYDGKRRVEHDVTL